MAWVDDAAEAAASQVTANLADGPSAEVLAEALKTALRDAAPPSELPEVVEVKVNLRRDAYQALQEIAEVYKTDLTTALHQCIFTELGVARAKQSGPVARMKSR